MSEVKLSPEQIDEIAERAVEKVLTRLYSEIGKSVVRKFAWLVGIVVLSLCLWLAGKNALQIPK